MCVWLEEVLSTKTDWKRAGVGSWACGGVAVEGLLKVEGEGRNRDSCRGTRGQVRFPRQNRTHAIPTPPIILGK